jgi:hypothetical protein
MMQAYSAGRPPFFITQRMRSVTNTGIDFSIFGSHQERRFQMLLSARTTSLALA